MSTVIDNVLECLTVELNINNKENIIICSCYSKPGSSIDICIDTLEGIFRNTIYMHWFNKVFLLQYYAPSERPLLLLKDGASAHLRTNLIDAVIKNDVILLYFPPRLTHILQPCDVGIYRSMKGNLSQIMQRSKC